MIKVTVLGTSAMLPLPDRGLTSVALSCNGHTILFDCGEGTQRAARKYGISLMKCEIIALTHYHGDHIFGIPGLLQTMNVLGRDMPLFIVGPKGIEKALEPIMTLVGALNYEVFLLENDEPIEIFPEAVLTSFKTYHKGESSGYIFSLGRPGEFSVEKAKALGVDKNDWGKLQHGQTIGDITPEMVLGERRKGLKFVISGDTVACDELREAADGADLFICEATFAGDEFEEQASKYKHMTFSQAVEVGSKAEKTVLVHFSQMIDDVNAYPLPENVIAAEDGMSFTLEFD